MGVLLTERAKNKPLDDEDKILLCKDAGKFLLLVTCIYYFNKITKKKVVLYYDT